jgi:hypothetical protein
MDSDTAKELVLLKLLDEFVPKIVNCYSILSEEQDSYTWSPNFFLIEENQRMIDSDITINIHITLNKFNCFEKINFRKTKYQHNHHFRRIAAAAADIAPPEITEFELTNKEKSIKEICKHVDLKYLIKIGICAMNEISNHENPANFSIGSLKKILNIKSDIDITNLETRKLLLEFIK